MKRKNPTMRLNKTIGLMMAIVLTVAGLCVMPLVAQGAKGEEPAHSKTVSDNGDGTYKIELTVTGDAETDVTNDTHVNVLLVYDESSSMTMYNAPGSDSSRADSTEGALYGFVNGLINYQNQGVDIQIAEVGFGADAWQRSGWTDELDTVLAHFDENPDSGPDGVITAIHAYDSANPNHNGTNWAAALSAANNLIGSLDEERSSYNTFVVFITDGGPTAGSGNNILMPGPDVSWTEYQPYYLAATDTAYSIQSIGTVTLYGIYAFGSDANLLDDLMYFSTENKHRDQGEGGSIDDTSSSYDFGNSDSASYYYNAANVNSLNAAIDAIFSEIVNTLGIAEVEIADGTTSNVKASSGEIVDLVGVDEDSYEYWLSIPVVDNTFTRVSPSTGKSTTYTVTDNGDGTCTVTGGASDITVNGSVKSGVFKFKWEGATELSDGKTPPAATYENGAVNWDLGDDELLSGVTYSITFDVYPSQTALDYKARLENGEAYDDVVDADVQPYFDEDGNLATNTGATLKYVDTRTTDGEKTAGFKDPDRATTSASTMGVEKEWEGADAPDVDLEMNVLADGKQFATVTLNKDGGWKGEIRISYGIIKNDKALASAQGHDFSFAELPSVQYRWELEAPVVHPMIINGEPTMLVKEDAEKGYKAPDGATTYTIGDATYYVDDEISTLSAVNHRRSNLNLTKVVTGEGAPEDYAFPFTLTINNAKAENGSADDTNSDYYVWFSVRDSEGVVKDLTVTGATPEEGDTGYFYAESGKAFTVEMQAGWNLRVTNLPTDTTYSIEEGDLNHGFSFAKAENTGPADSTFKVEGQTATGTIEEYNAQAYEVTFTNDYSPRFVIVDPPVQKIIEGRDDLYNNGDFTFTIENTKAPEGVTAPLPTNTSVTNSPEFEKEGKEGYYEFGEIEFTEPGTYEYTVKESGEVAGVTNDAEASTGKTITFVVTEADDGTLTVSPTTDEVELSFTNTYAATGSVVLAAAKTLSGADLQEGQFTFKLSGEGVDQTKTNEADGTVIFDAIDYTEADAGKTYEYEITEVNDAKEGIKYDSHTCKVTVTVTDNGDGTLKTEAKYDDGAVASFVNEFNPNSVTVVLKATKVLEGRDLVADEFSFELADADGNVVATAKNAADGTIEFSSFLIEKAGTYTYTATEVAGTDEEITYDSAAKTYTVEVTEADGALVAKVTSDEGETATFTNKYTPKEEEKPEIPATGDALPIAGLLVVAAAAAVTGVVAIRRRSETLSRPTHKK